jgi:lysophospholipase L1-like esterase
MATGAGINVSSRARPQRIRSAAFIAMLGAGVPAVVAPSHAAEQPRTLFALGDSYSSGEGAKKFLRDTNTAGKNECRRATSAYPAMVAKRAKLTLSFAACSGATTQHILQVGQQPDSPPNVIGRYPQINMITEATKDDVITVGIGGNDAGFGKVVQTCLRSDCTESQSAWLTEIATVKSRVTATFRAIRQRTDATVFAVTYPNPLGERKCVVGFSQSEWDYLRIQFIPALNNAVRVAARDAGVNLIDLESSYDGFRLCEVPFKSAALNVLAINSTKNGTQVGNYLHNSFHPNARGHQLATSVVFEAITRTRTNPEPRPVDPTIAQTVPPATVDTPAEPIFNECGLIPDYVLTDTATRSTYVISDGAPLSFACVIRGESEPEPTKLNEKGQLVVAIRPGETVVVEYTDNTDRLNQLSVSR